MAYRSPTETGQSNGTRALLKASPSQVGDLSLQPSTRVASSKEGRMDVEEIIARATFATAPEPAPHAPLSARKFPPIAGMPLSDFRPIPLPLFAIQRLSQMKYVPYWYATHEGRMDALQRVTAPDAGADDLAVQLHFDDSLDTHVLVPVSTRHTPSPNVIPDDQLTIEQLTQGKSSFCGALKTLGWDQTHVLAHALLIARIESHATLRESPYAERALMHYFAEVRREYHAALASNAQNVPDISIINERRIQDFIFDLHMKDMTETLNEAQCKLSALLVSFRFSPFSFSKFAHDFRLALPRNIRLFTAGLGDRLTFARSVSALAFPPPVSDTESLCRSAA